MWQSVKFTLSNTWRAAKWLLLFYVGTQVTLAAFTIADIFIFKEATDAVTGKPTLLGLSLLGIISARLLLDVVKTIIDKFSDYSWALLDTKQVLFMNTQFVDKVAKLDLATFESPKTVGLIQRVFSRFQFQFKYYIKSIVDVAAAGVQFSVSLSVFFFASPVAALGIVIANAIPIVVRRKHAQGTFLIYRADDETKRRFGYTANMLTERGTLPEIKVARAFEFLKLRLLDVYRKWNTKQLMLEKRYAVRIALAECFPIISMFVFLTLIANRTVNGAMTPGTFVFFFSNVFVFSSSLWRLSRSLNSLYSDSLFINEAVEFFRLQSNIAFPTLSKSKRETLREKLDKPSVTIDHVSFRYPGEKKFALKDVTLYIPYGQNVALIGENGAGKTTLVKLLLRMYDPAEGRILVNGVDMREIPEHLLFRLYSTLFQDFGKFCLTVRENLEMAAGRRLTEEDMTKLLQFASAWNFVKEKKHGLDQQLGPEYTEGTDLSGGQWQRLAIARAYAKKAPILMLDEPTSMVDAKSEAEIFDRMRKEMKRDTLIFISHRFSTIKDAERIVVLDKGRVIEDGTHQELMDHKETYFKLYSIQAERYQRDFSS